MNLFNGAMKLIVTFICINCIIKGQHCISLSYKPSLLKTVSLSHQHVLSQPALVLGDTGGDAEGEALLPQQRVSSVAAAKGEDLPGVRQVRYQHLVRVTGPRVDQRSCNRTEERELIKRKNINLTCLWLLKSVPLRGKGRPREC